MHGPGARSDPRRSNIYIGGERSPQAAGHVPGVALRAHTLGNDAERCCDYEMSDHALHEESTVQVFRHFSSMAKKTPANHPGESLTGDS